MPDQNLTPENLSAWGSLAAAVLAAGMLVWRKTKGWLKPAFGAVFGVASALTTLKAGHDTLSAQHKDHEARLRLIESQIPPLIERDHQRSEDLEAMRLENQQQTEKLNQIANQITTLAVQQAAHSRQQDQVLNQLNILTESLLTRKDRK